MTAWILVCDTTQAKLFTTELPESDWTLVSEFEHPEGRESSREIRPSSPPGRMQSSAMGGHHTAVQPHTTPKEAEAHRFAKTLADYLDKAASRREFDELTLAAGPHFLGLLLATCSNQVTKHLKSSVDKDLVTLDARQLRDRLNEAVFAKE